MRRPPNIVLVIVFFAVGALGGRALRSRAPSSTDATQAKERPAVSSQANPASSAGTQAPLEPVVRLKQIASAANANKRGRMVAEIADDLDPAQIREALAELDKTHVRERQEITVRLVARWAKLEPQAAIDFAKSIKIGHQRDEVLGAAVKGWMEVDPSAAREWTLALTGPLKDGALRGLMSATAETDPKAACALVEKIAQRYDYRLAETLFDLWTERVPREAAEHAAKLPKGFLRDESLNVVAERWASNDLPGALAWAETMWDQKISRVEQRSHPSPCDAITNVLQIWMMQDREGALGWVNSLSDEKKRADILGTLVAVEGDRDPVQMTQLVIDGIESGELKNKLIEDIALRWVFRDSAGALKWATELNEPEIQQLVLPRLTVQLSAENAPIAIELAEKVGGAQKDSTIGGALRSWAGGDPRAAAAWLETRPPNSHYYYSVASSWARKDPEAATDWVNKLPAGAWKDGFVRDAVDQIEPSVGAQWINAVSDDQKREEACISLARRWLERDTEAARAWLANAPLNQKAKDDLLKPNAK